MFDVRVTKMRVAPHQGVAAYFSIQMGETTEDTFTPIFVISDVALIAKHDGTFFFRSPGRKMMKDGEEMKDAKGYTRYYRYFQSYAEEDSTGKFGRTKAAWKFEDRVIALATAEFEAGGSPAPKPQPKVRQTAGSTTTTEDDFDSVLDGEDDDSDLPF